MSLNEQLSEKWAGRRRAIVKSRINGLTFSAIGKLFGVSPSRASRLCGRGLGEIGVNEWEDPEWEHTAAVALGAREADRLFYEKNKDAIEAWRVEAAASAGIRRRRSEKIVEIDLGPLIMGEVTT